jgi:hypothetical protein
MEGVRLTRWLLSPVPTFKLWRRMKLWELRSYEQVIKLEQDRLIYQARLQARFGRSWRRKAPVEALMPLRLAKFGVPLADTAPAGLAAAGIEPVLLPPAPAQAELTRAAELPAGAERADEHGAARTAAPAAQDRAHDGRDRAGDDAQDRQPGRHLDPHDPQNQTGPHAQEQEQGQEQAQNGSARYESPWFAASQAAQEAYQGSYNPTYIEGLEPHPVPVPSGPGRTRPLGSGPSPEQPAQYEYQPQAPMPTHTQAQAQPQPQPQERPYAPQFEEPESEPVPDYTAEDKEFAELAYPVFRTYVKENNDWPKADHLDILLADRHGVRHPRSTALLRRLLPEFKHRHQADLESEHIA